MERDVEVLLDLESLFSDAKLVLWGAGETGQEFARRLSATRPDVTIVGFIDSYREGDWNGIPILNPAQIDTLGSDVLLIIASVFWSEIRKTLEASSSREYQILSNNLINQASHLSAYGSFYFDSDRRADLDARLAQITPHFHTALDRDVLRKLFDLRVDRKEAEFFAYVDELTQNQKKSFQTPDKYSRHLDLEGVRYVIEGGVYDGEDTYRLIQALKGLTSFKRFYAFDPFLEALHSGEYFSKIDQSICEFHQKVLWDCAEKIAFRVDRENPSNSTVLRETELVGIDIDVQDAVTIDAFIAEANTPVDLIKLDVEGSEMNVLKGARDSIVRWKPKLAISVYHRKEHMFEIPEFLLSLHADYKFSISVNNPSFVDMVLYAS
jgi:FkbM family methyltransferase